MIGPALAPAAPILPAVEVAAGRARPAESEPPPTRVQRSEGLADRPFTPPSVLAVPAIPEPGLLPAARYAITFARARWQRRGAIRTLSAEIKQDTEALDHVLGALGFAARAAKLEGRVFSAENAAITAAEDRAAVLDREHAEVDVRKADERSRFVDIERERTAKLGDAERAVEESQGELGNLEGKRRSLRDKRKDLERRQKAYLKTAEEQDKQAGAATMGESRQELRRAAEGLRREAGLIEPERQDLDRQLAGLERPIADAQTKLDGAKAELEAAKRSLADAREGHTHRLAELDAEQKRKAREIAQAHAEVARRLITLGTLVNLNRVDGASFTELYQRIDRLRGAITSRTTEIEKLTAEREAFDRGSLVRGGAVLGGAVVLLIALIAILRAVL
jgi:chromosome segregation ATPase